MRPYIKRKIVTLLYAFMLLAFIAVFAWLAVLPHIWLYKAVKKNSTETAALNQFIRQFHQEVVENLF